jgi:hypothetical protein
MLGGMDNTGINTLQRTRNEVQCQFKGIGLADLPLFRPTSINPGFGNGEASAL